MVPKCFCSAGTRGFGPPVVKMLVKVAAAAGIGYNWDLDLIPDPGNSICRGVAKKEKKY